jgi:alpha-mannosidase
VAGEPAGLEEAWQTLLLNHFHDILPGSSIGEVHARAERGPGGGGGGGWSRAGPASRRTRRDPLRAGGARW